MPGIPPGKETTPTVGTLHIIGAPTGNPDDLTVRAKRILGEIALVVSDRPGAQDLLAYHKIAVPHTILSNPAPPAAIGRILGILEKGDVAVLSAGTFVGPTGPSQAVIRAALERGFPIVPVPGPSMPLTALVISGLPVDSFVYLGQLRQQPTARRDLLTSIATERRTLVALESPRHLPRLLSELREMLGDRSLTVAASDLGCGDTWRGTIAQALEHLPSPPVVDPCVLVIGGSQEKAAIWNEDRLRAEIQDCWDQGLGAKEISRALASESGWPRREIYRLAVEASRLYDKE